jgi:hypothetical protein
MIKFLFFNIYIYSSKGKRKIKLLQALLYQQVAISINYKKENVAVLRRSNCDIYTVGFPRLTLLQLQINVAHIYFPVLLI